MDEMTAITELRAEAISAAGRPLPIAPESATHARAFTVQTLTGYRLDSDHIDDTALVVTELVANAVTHGNGGDLTRNIYLELGIWSKWTLITVDDRDPNVYDSPASGAWAESGRGLLIITALAERWWWHPRRFSKTANAVILRPDVTLTAEDDALLDCLEADG